ncbi:MAG TPA: bifunctional alpha,alpha-trehalose-phosphate synthase (UDP-forming)/trehalose-phosphatase [Candidatus Krumholzibacteria bacterium]|nr:bifunctional alpha,alpha-trehalose-phosphate synthase (UDP-forming)/trehalose-phosphatase [Candidatus Krumholzibacteria bacterium]
MGKQVLVSNRLPILPVRTKDGWGFTAAAGGLIAALSGVRDEVEFDWMGWAGLDVAPSEHDDLTRVFRERHRCHPVFLEQDQIDRFYNGFCNSVLWPLFHYSPGRVDFSLPHWNEYRRVNEMFADVVLSVCSEDDTVWVHDFHLFLLPQLLRAARPGLRIGFFLHIPFPSSEIYRLLPVRRELLTGILGSDLIGFQTPDYGRHFAASCLRVLGLACGVTEISYDGRQISYGSYPIGINPELFRRTLRSAAVAGHRERLAQSYAGRKVIVGVDRIDYTKGLVLKFEAYENYLEKHPEARGRDVLLQVAVPSRTLVPEYRRLKAEVDRIVGRINGRFGTSDYAPIQYLAHSTSFEELCALYERADVCLVTSVRDGMNLVALEYTACQRERHGVLVLSEFCGASSSLGSAIAVNPWDRTGVADAIHQALTMPPDERRRRAAANHEYVTAFNSTAWVRRFLRDLRAGRAAESDVAPDLRDRYFELRNAYRAASERLFLLDYDGTVVSFTEDPARAEPPAKLFAAIGTLAAHAANAVCFISGREPSELDRWFGDLPVALAAEHGMFFRDIASREWVQREDPPLDWMATVRGILEDYHARTPGSRVEQKRTCIVWHYRGTEEGFGERQSLELATHLEETLANVPVTVLQGDKVIEVRPQSINKGKLVADVLARRGSEPPFVLCVGDDRTDEDMFTALSGSAWTCRVGKRVTHARFYLPAPALVLDVLADLASLRE